MSEREIANEMKISRSTLHVDIKALKKQAMVNINLFAEQDLPHEVELLLENTNELLHYTWFNLEQEMRRFSTKPNPSHPLINSIIQILNLKTELLNYKMQIAEDNHTNHSNALLNMEDRARQEAYDRDRQNREAIF